MPFQFRCPQGHLLEGENEDVGQVVHCPICGVALTIPSAPYTPTATPIQPPVPPYQQQQQVPTADVIDTAPPVIEPEPETFPDVTANGSIEEAENEFALHTDDLQSAAAEQAAVDPRSGTSSRSGLGTSKLTNPHTHIAHLTTQFFFSSTELSH